MKPYLEPLLPGQGFSFVEPIYVGESTNRHRSMLYQLESSEAFGRRKGFKTVIEPGQRLRVHQNTGWGIGWSVHGVIEAGGRNRFLIFSQYLDLADRWRTVSRGVFDPPCEEKEACLKVGDAQWLPPTREALIKHLYGVAWWPDSPLRTDRRHIVVPSSLCEQISASPIEYGVSLAMNWLEATVGIADPGAVLRKRGFDV